MKKLAFIPLIGLFLSCNLTDEATPVIEESTIEDTLIGTTPPNGTTNTSSDSATNTNPAGNETWMIALFVEEGYDFSKNFQEVRLQFKESGIIEASLGDQPVSGRWKIERDLPRDELYLDFPSGTLLDELDDDWYISSQTDTEIILEYREDGYESKLILVRETHESTITPPFSLQKENSELLFDEVFESSFEISSFWEENRNMTLAFDGGILVFEAWGKVSLVKNGQQPIRGLWLVGFNDQNVLLDLDFPSPGLGNYLDDDWALVSKEGGLIQFIELDDSDRDRLELVKI